jgi:dTDP-4-dehydrorhamnose reductase
VKALVFGSTGQVAQELRTRLPNAIFLSRSDADLREPDRCADAIAACDAEVVINAAAYTAVDQAESDEDVAMRVNATAPARMAQAAAARGLPFLHISTDYVFDGSGTRPWQPDDATGTVGVTDMEDPGSDAAQQPPAQFVRGAVGIIEENDELRIVKGSLGGREIDAMTSDI